MSNLERSYIHIKNMVCNRCITAVSEILINMGFKIIEIKLGEVQTSKALTAKELQILNEELKKIGFELLDDKRFQLIEKIKTVIIENIHSKNPSSIYLNFSHIIQEAIGRDYQYLSTLFSTMEGITIEKFIIRHKIERAKELLLYDELTLSEISYQLGYSSVQHLSTQFHKTTGVTPTIFKKSKDQLRNPLDLLN